jgi:kynurenine formamidase
MTMGLRFYDLSNRWGHGMPRWPGGGDGPSRALNVAPIEYHAKHGVFTQHVEFIMHRGTHMDAPIHVMEDTPTITDYELWRFFGTGVAVSIPKGKWGVITPEDLEAATPAIQPGDIVMINTGAHRLYGDNEDYYAYSPGLYKEAAQWLVARKVKMVGVDVQALDHPLGTYMVPHGSGPTMPHLAAEYKAETGREVLEDFPLWEPAHKILMGNGIPGIENVGGELDQVTGRRCTFMAFPWRWPQGEGCGVRVVAVIDPGQEFRIGGDPLGGSA